jgi:homopolymeric O-antigen transport system ATP-binding protein
MSEIAISVSGLSKRYRIGAQQQMYATLRDKLNDKAMAPFRAARHLLTRNGGRNGNGNGPPRSDLIWALKDVSFEVHRGEVVGIIGRNGAGKSTLLKILSRITEPTQGYADISGRLASLLEVGTGFHPELTGRDNIFLNGSILGMRRAEIQRKFDEIVAFAEIEKFIDTPVKHYSSGMYVRLAFAVAAHLDPDILLVDEVLAVGDAAFQKKCLGKMGDVAKEGRTVLFVSHNMAAIQQLCPRTLLFSSGALSADSSTDRTMAVYLSDALASDHGVFDLHNHPARDIRFRPFIVQLALSSTKGNSKTSFAHNEPVNIELTIDPPERVTNPRAAIAIEDCYGRRIMTAASYFEANELAHIDKGCRVTCTIANLSLGSGRYLISVSIGDKYFGLLDSIDNAAWFDVEGSNPYANGEPYLPVYGPVLKSSTWKQAFD